jgi:hypothetical protein
MNLSHLLIISDKLAWTNEKLINIINCHVALLLLLLKIMFYFILMKILNIYIINKKIIYEHMVNI